MTFVNVVALFLICEAAGVFFSFASIIENARRAARDAQRGHFRALVLDTGLEWALDFVDANYSHSTVSSLRAARASLVTLVLATFTFWLAGYYVSTTTIPPILSVATAAGLGGPQLTWIITQLEMIPFALFVGAGALETLIFFYLGWICVSHDLRKTVWRVMNPQGSGEGGKRE